MGSSAGNGGRLLVLRGPEIEALLADNQQRVLDAVAEAYRAHAQGQSSLPHSTFLHFPGQPDDRIIALPAYLGATRPTAGIKWISSFPGNRAKGLDRASAVVVLNSLETGRPEALLEGSVISAQRTAAGAVLAAQRLRGSEAPSALGLIGCGLINAHVARFALGAFPEMTTLVVHDSDAAQARRFHARLGPSAARVEVRVVGDAKAVLASAPIVSLATTALSPHLGDVSAWRPGTLILHLSLRDLTPEVILACDNVVDDIDHVCRARTSVHLAEQAVGHRRFLRCTLGEVLLGQAPPRTDAQGVLVYSPFGLGILDLAVAQLVCLLAQESGRGLWVEDFFP